MGKEDETDTEVHRRALRRSRFAPLPSLPAPSRSQPRLAHPAGPMTTNKAAALAKFLERKLQEPGGLTSINPDLLERAVNNAKDTIKASKGGISTSGRIVRHVASFGDDYEDLEKDERESPDRSEETKQKKKKMRKNKKKKVKMAIDDDYWQQSVSSQFLDIGSGELNESMDPLSQEDAAWVESCLIKESEFSIGSLESLKDALWEALTEQISPYSSLAGADIDIHGRNGHEYVTSEQSEGTGVRGYVRDNLFSTSLVLEEDKNVEDGGVAVISTEDIESHEDIFRVWDLSMPLEGDEFVQELDKALIERPPCVPSPTLYDTGAADGCSPENLVAGMADGLDDLVAGMADLSLHPWSE